jgi:hypothetical protein
MPVINIGRQIRVMVPTGRESEYAVTLRQLVIKVQRRIHNADASLEVIR